MAVEEAIRLGVVFSAYPRRTTGLPWENSTLKRELSVLKIRKGLRIRAVRSGGAYPNK
jgi:hypothetical protein